MKTALEKLQACVVIKSTYDAHLADYREKATTSNGVATLHNMRLMTQQVNPDTGKPKMFNPEKCEALWQVGVEEGLWEDEETEEAPEQEVSEVS